MTKAIVLPSNGETYELVKALVPQFSGKTFDAIQLTGAITEKYNLSVDWHMCSYVLDDMTRSNPEVVTCVNAFGMCKYQIADGIALR